MLEFPSLSLSLCFVIKFQISISFSYIYIYSFYVVMSDLKTKKKRVEESSARCVLAIREDTGDIGIQDIETQRASLGCFWGCSVCL